MRLVVGEGTPGAPRPAGHDPLRTLNDSQNEHARHISFDLAKRPTARNPCRAHFDTTSPAGRLMLNVFSSVAQFESEIMLERQREGVQRAKREGKYKGRAPTAHTKSAPTSSSSPASPR